MINHRKRTREKEREPVYREVLAFFLSFSLSLPHSLSRGFNVIALKAEIKNVNLTTDLAQWFVHVVECNRRDRRLDSICVDESHPRPATHALRFPPIRLLCHG
jgi:hypothetical protein